MDLDASLSLNPDLLVDPKEFSPLVHVVESLQQSYSTGESSSVVRPRDSYERDLEAVTGVVNKVVDDHYDSFNGSVRSFSKIFKQFTEAQSRVRGLKERVARCKSSMINRKRNLGSLTYEKMRYEVIIDLLEKVQLLHASPLRIGHLLNGGKYEKCVDLLLEMHDLAYGPELEKVNALKLVREELVLWRHRIQSKIVAMLVRSLGAKASEELQVCGSVEEFSTLLKALKKLKRIPAALRQIKDTLRDQIQDIIKGTCAQHLSRARSKLVDPISFLNSKGSSSQETWDIGDFKVDSFVHLLARLKQLLGAHVCFFKALKQVCDPEEAELYSVRQTWSVVQVEVQQFLDLHLTSDPSNVAQLYPSEQSIYVPPSATESEELPSLKFRFSVRETTVAETKALFRSQSETHLEEIQPLFRPSSYWIIPLYRPVADFAKECDALLNFSSRQQLLSYVTSFCNDVFLPNLITDSLSRLQACARSESAFELKRLSVPLVQNSTSELAGKEKQKHTVLSKLALILYEELQSLRRYQSFLGGLCSLEPVAFQLLEEFFLHAKGAVDSVLSRGGTEKLCYRHVMDQAKTIRKDPYYHAERAADAADLSEALREFNRTERRTELLLKESLLGMYTSPIEAGDMDPLFLRTRDLWLLGITHTSCGWLFEDIVGESKTKGAVQENLFGSTRARTLLGELDNLAESCIFYVRSEIRLRCALRLHAVSKELLQDPLSQRSVAASKLSAELIEAADSLSPCLSKHRYNFVFHGVSVLCSELLVRSVYFGNAMYARSREPGSERKPFIVKVHAVYLKRISLTLQNVLWSIRITAIDSHINAFDGARLFFLCFIQDRDKDQVKRNLASAARMLDTMLYDDFVRIYSSVVST